MRVDRSPISSTVPSLLAEPAEVADTDGLIEDQRDPAEQVLDGLLRGQSHREPADPEAGQDAGDVDADVLQDRDESQDGDDDLRGLHAERHDGARGRATPPRVLVGQEAAHHVAGAKDEPRDDEDGEGLFEVAEDAARGDREGEQRAARGKDHEADGEAQRADEGGDEAITQDGSGAPDEWPRASQHDERAHPGERRRHGDEEQEADPLPERQIEESDLEEGRRQIVSQGPIPVFPVEAWDLGDRGGRDLPEPRVTVALHALEDDGRRARLVLDRAHELAVGREAVPPAAVLLVTERFRVRGERLVEDDPKLARECGAVLSARGRGQPPEVEELRGADVVAVVGGIEEARHRVPRRPPVQRVHGSARGGRVGPALLRDGRLGGGGRAATGR